MSGVWARATAPGQKVAGVFLEITASTDARLVGAKTPAAGVAELHFMSMEDGVMRMREVQEIDLPHGATVSLKPGGYHVMLFDLKQPLRPGESIPLTLTVVGRDNRPVAVETQISVRNLDGSKPQ
ncbi:MAG TPA: copper chaperone PCu(A)C [Burkholderiales bacterium]|nr:copper chaperone PCu(A)C [Burkholderiales bacterium]